MTESILSPKGNIEDALIKAFLLNHPKDAARKVETMQPAEAAELLSTQPTYVLQPVWKNLPPGVADNLLQHLPDTAIKDILTTMDSGLCAALLSRFEEPQREQFFALLDQNIVSELKELMEYPADSAGAMMETNITAFNENTTVADTLTLLRNQKIKDLNHLYLLTDDMYLSGRVPVQRLALAEGNEKLSTLAIPLVSYVTALDPKSEVMEKIEKLKLDTIPVVDGNDQFVGVIRGRNILDEIKNTLATEMLTMVGASKEEKALSTSWFAVKKRLPWLQINLVTAFLAAAVVGMFEETIAKYTALAILLPIAAGQSGNTGAQSLAVTMRGLTLREITIRHWPGVLKKEAGAALINGIAIAVTCGTGVYIWSSSLGLALIIALALISSMTIAAISGALVPIVLKKLGQDPALSSSIILTTITDIAGFMSFLGIATALSGMLAG
ncbi:magnesium transporter [Litoribrevibacter euphylliae]|uniref:Magnesium transporter MgtE n=1 Tax=Litoribrevibacter euphylliae TaxID=1834034 RepID=A0ABV7HFV7_9GAMM